MERADFLKWIHDKPLILDGATGTHLQENGLKPGACPTRWVLENPDVLVRLQSAYYESGSDLVLAFSFGANRKKLDPVLLQNQTVAEINRQVASLSLKVRNDCEKRLGKHLLVAGDLAPTGHFLYPAGDLDLESLVTIYGEQVDGLLKAGVDLFFIETMLDLAQTRAAVLAIRDRCDLPIIASLTITENGRSLSGDLPLASLLSLQAVGVDAFGFNCSFGPEKLAEVLLPLLEKASVPLMIKPNAGMPRLIDGKTIFPLNPADFSLAMIPLLKAGIRLIGGCCGTGPDHIRQLAESVAGLTIPPFMPQEPERVIGSARQVLELSDQTQWAVLTVTDPSELMEQVLDAQDDEPDGLLLDLRQVTEDATDGLLLALSEVVLSVPLPMAFEAEGELLEQVLRYYPGRAAIKGGPVPAKIDAVMI